VAVSVRIVAEDVVLKAELNDTPCAARLAEILPIEASPHTWGDEFYFEVSLTHELDPTATSNVEVGDIGYWPPGRALAIFFGPTPMSTGSKPVPASDVNLVGRITDDAALLRKVRRTTRIRIEAA
jgi:hypothetical protein